MKISPEERKRIKAGEPITLKVVLSRELEDIKKQLLTFRTTSPEYDNVLKGRGAVIVDILELLE